MTRDTEKLKTIQVFLFVLKKLKWIKLSKNLVSKAQEVSEEK